jgi:hypothetical protein
VSLRLTVACIRHGLSIWHLLNVFLELREYRVEISQAVKDKIAEAIELWAEETLDGKPALLATVTYFGLVKDLQKRTDEICESFV